MCSPNKINFLDIDGISIGLDLVMFLVRVGCGAAVGV